MGSIEHAARLNVYGKSIILDLLYVRFGHLFDELSTFQFTQSSCPRRMHKHADYVSKNGMHSGRAEIDRIECVYVCRYAGAL